MFWTFASFFKDLEVLDSAVLHVLDTRKFLERSEKRTRDTTVCDL